MKNKVKITTNVPKLVYLFIERIAIIFIPIKSIEYNNIYNNLTVFKNI
jgi:hypothetical protein